MSDLLELARAIEAEDRKLAGEIAVLQPLQQRAAAVATRAAELAGFQGSLPFERMRLVDALADGRAELAEREREHAEAERLVATEQGEALAEARRAAVRTADTASVVRRSIERHEEEHRELEAAAAAVDGQLAALAAEAAGVTAAIRAAESIAHGTVPDPPADAGGLVEWGSRARATFLVALSGLESRRERVSREANELAAAAFGEPVALSATAVRERLEAL